MILINLGSFVVLVAMGYRPEQSGWLVASAPRRRKLAVVGTAVFLLVVAGTAGGATAQQVGLERTVTQEVDGLLSEPEYDDIESVTVDMEYAGMAPGIETEPPTVTVVAAYSGAGEPPTIAEELDGRIAAATGTDLFVRVEFVEYDTVLSTAQ